MRHVNVASPDTKRASTSKPMRGLDDEDPATNSSPVTHPPLDMTGKPQVRGLDDRLEPLAVTDPEPQPVVATPEAEEVS